MSKENLDKTPVFQHSIAMPGILDLSVVIVSWNVSKLLRDCLESIYHLPLAEQPREVFVVDNASTDGTVEMVREQFPQVRCIENSENRGFAAANNQAIKNSTSQNVLLLNPDTVVHAGAFSKMLQVFVSHPKAGIVGPKLLNFNGSYQPSVRRLPTVTALAAIALKLRYLWPNFPPLRRYMAADLDSENEQAVGQVMGAAFLIRRSVINKIGMLDEGFHVWFEEVDYCKRAADAGWETWYVPSATITHIGGQSFAQQPSVPKQQQWHRSVLHYSRKHFSKLATGFLWLVGRNGLFATWCAAFFKRHTIPRLVAIPVLLALLTGLASFRVGLLSDDWDWYYEGRMTQDEITRPLTHNVGGAFYRPLSTYSYALDYAIAPYNVPIARTQHLVLFIATVALLVIFVWQMTGQAWVATTSGAFFSLWPQHHEVTTWLGSRPDLLSLLWILAALVTFTAAIRRKKPVLFALTVLWAGAAILSKESGVLVIPTLLLVAFTLRRLRDRRVWATIIGSGIVIAFFLYVRSLVLGQLVGGYGDSQTQIGLGDIGKLFLSIIEGWLNWSWLGAQFSISSVQITRYVIVSIMGLSFLAGLVLSWRSFKQHWRTFAMLVVWFVLAICISLPLMQTVNLMDLNGTRYLYFASNVLTVGLAYFVFLLKARKRNTILLGVILAVAWMINLQPWREASAENRNIISQVQKYVPSPPQAAIITVRALPGDTYGAVQWYAHRSLPEALVAAYNRQDLYAPAAFEDSVFCSQSPQGKVVEFIYTRATGVVSYIGTSTKSNLKGTQKKDTVPISVVSTEPGIFVGTANKQTWRGYRGLIVTVDSKKNGFIALQLRGEGNTLYNKTVVQVKSGRNEIYFSLCAMRVWVLNPPINSVRIITTVDNSVVAMRLVAPYAL